MLSQRAHSIYLLDFPQCRQEQGAGVWPGSDGPVFTLRVKCGKTSGVWLEQMLFQNDPCCGHIRRV